MKRTSHAQHITEPILHFPSCSDISTHHTTKIRLLKCFSVLFRRNHLFPLILATASTAWNRRHPAIPSTHPIQAMSMKHQEASRKGPFIRRGAGYQPTGTLQDQAKPTTKMSSVVIKKSRLHQNKSQPPCSIFLVFIRARQTANLLLLSSLCSVRRYYNTGCLPGTVGDCK
jgi:hypothetical protein